MKKTVAHAATNTAENKITAGNLHAGRELFDTAWRIAAPVVVFAAFGILADRQFDTRPWLTLVGVVVGFLLALLLVKRQIGDWDGKE